jgi:hypothetical protein
VWRQLRWLLLRGLLKQRRAWTWATPPTPLVDLLLVVGAGLIVGFIHSGHDTLQQAPQQVGCWGTRGEAVSSCCRLVVFCTCKPPAGSVAFRTCNGLCSSGCMQALSHRRSTVAHIHAKEAHTRCVIR